MNAAIAVRPLKGDDVTVLCGVLARAYDSRQNFRDRLLRAYLDTHAIATFVAEFEGRPVGMVIGNDYGPTVYVAQMAVDPPLHRRGIGAALMDGLVAWADRRGFATVELDATPHGEPLYARYDFRPTAQTLVYLSTLGGGTVRDGVRRYTPADRAAVAELDARAFGADRGVALEPLLDSTRAAAFVATAGGSVCGYAVAQPQSEFLGPVIATDAAVAEALVDAARTELPPVHRLALPSDNAAALAFAAARGYRFSRALAHMVRGAPPAGERTMLYARISLGQG